MIAQLSNASEVQKLYVNQSMAPHTPVTVEVERDGLYQVTIFPIREGRGILESGAVQTQLVAVGLNYIPTSTSHTDMLTTFEQRICLPITASTCVRIPTDSIPPLIHSPIHPNAGLGSALGVFSVALLGLVLALLWKIKTLQRELKL